MLAIVDDWIPVNVDPDSLGSLLNVDLFIDVSRVP